MIKNDPEIKKAHQKYEEFISDEHMQHLYLAREMYQHDQASRLGNAEERGAEKKEQQIIIKMKDKGYSAEEVFEITGIDVDIIKKCFTDNG